MGKNKRNNKHQQQQQQQKSSQPNEATSTTSTEKDKDTVAPATGKPSVDEHRLKANKIALEILEAVQRQPANPNEEWQQYVQLQQLLEQMIVYEKPLQREEFPTGEDNCSTQTRMDKLASFNAWAVAGGVKSSSVEIATFDGYQLGLRATRDLNAGEQVLSVPRQLIFSEEHLSEAQVFSYYPSLTNFHLAFALVIEKVRGAASNWKPYIDILPPRYNTVLYFTVEQMQLMRGTSAIAAALRQCRGIARQYASMYKCAYIQPDDSIMTAMSVLFTQYGLCYDLYRWAVSTVMTRQNLVPREKLPENKKLAAELKKLPISALIPFWDMANHRSGEITSFYDVKTKQMECAAQEPFKTGDQFFIYYGDRSNADLLVHNGFLDSQNAKDYVQIKLGLNPADVLAEQRSLLLNKLNIERKAELRVLPAPEHISGELLAFVRVFNMSAAQLEHWCSDLERAVDLLHIDCALETDLETRTWQYLYQRLKLLLGVLDATLPAQAQEKLLAAETDAAGEREINAMLLEYRRLERCILNDALNYAQERLKV